MKDIMKITFGEKEKDDIYFTMTSNQWIPLPNISNTPFYYNRCIDNLNHLFELYKMDKRILGIVDDMENLNKYLRLEYIDNDVRKVKPLTDSISDLIHHIIQFSENNRNLTDFYYRKLYIYLTDIR